MTYQNVCICIIIDTACLKGIGNAHINCLSILVSVMCFVTQCACLSPQIRCYLSRQVAERLNSTYDNLIMLATSTCIILALHYSDTELSKIGQQFCSLQFNHMRKLLILEQCIGYQLTTKLFSDQNNIGITMCRGIMTPKIQMIF